MRKIKRLIFVIGMAIISLISIPLCFLWIFNGKDLVSPMFDFWVLKFEDDIL